MFTRAEIFWLITSKRDDLSRHVSHLLFRDMTRIHIGVGSESTRKRTKGNATTDKTVSAIEYFSARKIKAIILCRENDAAPTCLSKEVKAVASSDIFPFLRKRRMTSHFHLMNSRQCGNWLRKIKRIIIIRVFVILKLSECIVT